MRELRATEKVMSAPSPTTVSTSLTPGPIEAPFPIRDAPCRKVIGWMTVSDPIRTSTSTYAVAGSTNDTPRSMCPSTIRPRMIAMSLASVTRELRPTQLPPKSAVTTATRSPFSIRMPRTSGR